MRIMLVLQYDGTNFCGWQVQPGLRTVQGELENAVFSLTGERVSVIASGRTDSGVHARGQVAHFDTNSTIPPENFCRALNVLLPSDVKVIKSELAPENFHSRFSAKKKTYIYRFYKSSVELPLYSRYACRIDEKTDETAMNQAAQALVGTHDFKCFMSSGSDVKNTVRTIYECRIYKNGDLLELKVCGNGFLYNMVRAIAGTLYFVGLGKSSVESVKAAIESKDRFFAGKTMPPQGLTLEEVFYLPEKISEETTDKKCPKVPLAGL